MDDAPTTLDLINLGIAVVGSGLAIASLSWQFATWKMTGPRVKVTMKGGLLGPGGAVTFPTDAPANAVQSAMAQGYTQLVLAVEVVNEGRMATSIEKVSARFDESRMEFTEDRVPRCGVGPCVGLGQVRGAAGRESTSWLWSVSSGLRVAAAM